MQLVCASESHQASKTRCLVLFHHNESCLLEQWLLQKSQKEILLKKYNDLTKQAYELSHSNRTASDQKTKEANDVLDQINKLEEWIIILHSHLLSITYIMTSLLVLIYERSWSLQCSNQYP